MSKNIPHEIEMAQSLYAEMKQESAKYTKLAELTFDNLVKAVRRNVQYLIYDAALPGASGYLDELKRGNTPDEDADVTASYNLLCHTLENEITGGVTVKITEITRLGYDNYCWSVAFTCDTGIDRTYMLDIPVMDKISTENFYYAHQGKLYLGYYKNSTVIDYICASYDTKEVHDSFSDFINVGADAFANGVRVAKL